MKLLTLKITALSLIATSGVHAFEYEDESTSSSSLLRISKDPKNRIHCKYDSDFKKKKNIKQACRSLKDDHTVPYECDSGMEICCTESNIKNPTFKTFGTCHIKNGDDESKEEMNEESTPTVKSGQCVNTGPRRTRESQVAVCRKLGDTTEAYYCTQPGHYCCTPDTPAIVKTDWGVCNRGRGDEDNQENVEDMEHLADDLDDTEEDILAISANQEIIIADESKASIRCIEPTIRMRRGESIVQACKANPATPNPYVCDAGGQLCCTTSSITNPTLDGYGKCHKLYIPNEHGRDEVFSQV